MAQITALGDSAEPSANRISVPDASTARPRSSMPCRRRRGARAGADQRVAVLQPLTQPRLDRHAHEAAGFEIAEQVAAEQPLRQRGLPRADGEMHLVGRRELFGDLVAGVAAAHHQHGPAGNVGRPAVVGAVHLDDARVELLGDGRHPRRLKRPRGDHHLLGGVRAVAQLDHEAARRRRRGPRGPRCRTARAG